MPRKRMVSPELLVSVTVAQLPIPARYAFVGLWMYLDDEGRGADNLDLLRAHLWPLDVKYTVSKVEADLQAWAHRRLVCRYTVNGAALLHVPLAKWKHWQKINHPTPSRLPACPVDLAGEDHDLLPGDYRSATGVLLESYGSGPVGVPPRVVKDSSIEGSSSGIAVDVCEHGNPARFCHPCKISA